MNITILGAGAYGTALATILTENHHAVTFFDPFKYPELTLDNAISSADVIVIATPAHAVEALAKTLVKAQKPLILATKGLLSLTPFAPHPVTPLSGGAFAIDIIAKKTTVLTTTSPLARSLFTTPWCHIQITPDATGIILCGSLKNIYALGAGILAAPPNYVDKCLAELKVYLAKHGAFATTANLSCGIDDLRLTCTDPRSRNFSYGRSFRIHPAPPTTTVEGLTALATITDHKKYPILHAIHNIFSGKQKAIETLARLTQ